MKRLFILLLLPTWAQAAPWLISDPTTQTVTHCGIHITDTVLNTTKKVDSPVENVTGGKRCRYDLAGTVPGKYSFAATYFIVDPVWGRQESVTSVPLELTRPNIPTSPVGLGLAQ